MAEASGEDMAEAIAIPFFSCALFVFTHLISERLRLSHRSFDSLHKTRTGSENRFQQIPNFLEGSEPLWRSGNWNELRWSVVNAPVLSRMTVDLDDYLQRYTWQETEGKWFSVYTVPRDRYDRYSRCGPNSNCDNSRAEFECTCLADGSTGWLRKEGVEGTGTGRVCEGGRWKVRSPRYIGGTCEHEHELGRVQRGVPEGVFLQCIRGCKCEGSGSGCLSWHGDLFWWWGAAVILVLLVSSFWFLRKKMERGKQNKMLYNLRLAATWLEDSLGAKEHDENETTKSLSNWRIRFEIIIGIAQRILYLHEDSRLKIIHIDLKASNVLLDAKMLPMEEIKWKETQVSVLLLSRQSIHELSWKCE
ncbi:hypothetical protein AAG906_028894 [Vitis piasezkii]